MQPPRKGQACTGGERSDRNLCCRFVPSPTFPPFSGATLDRLSSTHPALFMRVKPLPFPSNAHTRPKGGHGGFRRLLLSLFLGGGAIAVGCLLWFWREQTRPGTQHYLRGMEYLSTRRPASAEREWLLGVQQDPGFYPCHEQLGELYMQLLRFPEAAREYAEAARLAPNEGSLWSRLARALRRVGNKPEAMKAARRAAQLLPNDADALGDYGILEAELKDRQPALLALRRAHQLRPQERRYFIALVNTELDALDIDAAERDLTPYVRAHPEDAQASFLMEVVFDHKPRTPENLKTAIAYGRLAIKGMPDDEQVYIVLGQLELNADDTRRALNVYGAGLRRWPNSPGIIHGLVECFTRTGDTRRRKLAAADFEKVTRSHDRIAHLKHLMGFNHNDISSGLELARLEEDEGNTQQARTYFEQLVRQSPKESRTRKALIQFYKRHGQADLAQRATRPDFIP